MLVRTKNVIKTIVTVALIGTSVFAGAQSYYGNPYTGAGSTIQPSQQYLQQQRQWQARPQPQQRLPTHTPSVTDKNGNQFMYRPELGTWVPTQLSPQTAKRIGDFAGNCLPGAVEGAMWGGAGGGRRGALVGAAQGCLNR